MFSHGSNVEEIDIGAAVVVNRIKLSSKNSCVSRGFNSYNEYPLKFAKIKIKKSMMVPFEYCD